MGVCVFVCVSADGVDGAIIGEASESHVVVYKQMEQKFISANKNNNDRLTAFDPGQPG